MHNSKLVQKEPTDKRCLGALDFRSFRSQLKGKHFEWQIIPQCNCGRKETVDIINLIPSRNGDRKIRLSRITSGPAMRIQKAKLSKWFFQKIYQSILSQKPMAKKVKN